MKVGIIGGTGRMGRVFRSVFTKAGHAVTVSGRRTSVSNEEVARSSDVLVISVPIHDTVRVIGEISGILNEEQVLCDLTSLKVAPVEAMLRSRAEVLGLHPMFGPTVESIRGQTIVATPARCSDATLQFFTEIFESQGARVTLTTPAEHDRMMAVIQGLTHFKALVLAETMRRLGISPDETAQYMSPVYRIEMNIAGRLLAQDPMLYHDILTQNAAVNEVLQTCLDSADALRGIVIGGRSDAFEAFFLENRRWFGNSCEEALHETDLLIQSLVER